MKKTDIKNLLAAVAVMMTTLVALPSCLSDNNGTSTSSDCAIVDFSVSNITSYVTEKKYDSKGNATDTIVSRVTLGSDIHFNIDQVNNRIHVIDSLPNWVDITAVVPSYTSFGSVYLKTETSDGPYSRLFSGVDSIDFSETVQLLCVSTDGLAERIYEVDIFKHKAQTDTLEWKEATANLAIKGESKAFCADGKVFLFAKNADGNDIVTVADNHDYTEWSAPVTIPVQSGSIVRFNGQFYGLTTDGYIYSSTPDLMAASWEKACDQKVESLLAADDYYLYAYDGIAIIGSSNLEEWEQQGMTDLPLLPETCIASISYPSKTNSNIQTAVMVGLSSQNTENGVTWHKVSSLEKATNQAWAYIQVTNDNPFGMPYLNHLSITYYDNAIFAIGAEEGTYKYLYRSDDNGISWHPLTAKYPLPKGLEAENGAASIVATEEELWIIQENGKVWKGYMQ